MENIIVGCCYWKKVCPQIVTLFPQIKSSPDFSLYTWLNHVLVTYGYDIFQVHRVKLINMFWS